jgi:hypothetical protein
LTVELNLFHGCPLKTVTVFIIWYSKLLICYLLDKTDHLLFENVLFLFQMEGKVFWLINKNYNLFILLNCSNDGRRKLNNNTRVSLTVCQDSQVLNKFGYDRDWIELSFAIDGFCTITNNYSNLCLILVTSIWHYWIVIEVSNPQGLGELLVWD